MAVSFKNLIKRLTTLVVIPSMALSMTGCDLALFDSKGPIGEAIGSTMIWTVLVMLIVVIPTIILSVVIPYKYRASNKKADYKPEWSHSTLIEIIVWGIPIIIILFLAVETYKTSHSLDPHKEIGTDLVPDLKPNERPLKIQAVALDWKWLFIYPEEGIATVNEIAVPVGKPVQFLLSSDGAINSFFIPRFGGQLYAMAGMENKLNLMASEKGTYTGISSNYSGFGFSNMRFDVRAMDKAGFDEWVANAQQSPKTLDDATYEELATEERPYACGKLSCRREKPYPATYYVNPDPLRFKNIIDQNIGLDDRPVEKHGAEGEGNGTKSEGEHEQAESNGEASSHE